MPPARPLLLQSLSVRALAVFRALQLGDLLCAVPALRALRSALPGARITLVGLPWAEQFARRFARYVDDFVAFPGHPDLPEQPPQAERFPAFAKEMRARRFDLALQMHGDGRISNRIVQGFGARAVAGFSPAREAAADPRRFLPYPDGGPDPLRLLALAAFLGAPAAGSELEFPLASGDEAELAASGLAAGLVPGGYVCIHPGARFRDKCWPPHCFAAVADRLAAEFCLAPVLTGSPQEADLAQAVAARMRTSALNAAGPLSLGAMAALMRRARLLVCNDTGVSHIAAGLRLPSVVVFNRADPGRWSPLDRELHRSVSDPEGRRMSAVLAEARRLLAAIPASRD